MKKMRSRAWSNSPPELEAYSSAVENGLYPGRAVEMHGPHQPIGTDTMIAKAFSCAWRKPPTA